MFGVRGFRAKSKKVRLRSLCLDQQLPTRGAPLAEVEASQSNTDSRFDSVGYDLERFDGEREDRNPSPEPVRVSRFRIA